MTQSLEALRLILQVVQVRLPPPPSLDQAGGKLTVHSRRPVPTSTPFGYPSNQGNRSKVLGLLPPLKYFFFLSRDEHLMYLPTHLENLNLSWTKVSDEVPLAAATLSPTRGANDHYCRVSVTSRRSRRACEVCHWRRVRISLMEARSALSIAARDLRIDQSLVVKE